MLSNCGAGEDSWESLDNKEIKPVNHKGNQPWIFIGSTDAEAKSPTFCSPDAKNWLIWKDPGAGKYWGQEEKGEDWGRDGWNHQLDGHQLEHEWANSRRQWRTGKPRVQQSVGSQRARHDLVTEQQKTPPPGREKLFFLLKQGLSWEVQDLRASGQGKVDVQPRHLFQICPTRNFHSSDKVPWLWF